MQESVRNHGDSMPPILVISLEESTDRRRRVKENLSSLGLEYEFVPGVRFSKFSKTEARRLFDRGAAFEFLNRDMHPNEVGCALAHLNAYKRMIERGDDCCLIMEDDVTLNPDFPEVLAAAIREMPDDWRLLNLAHDMAEPIGLRELPPLEGKYSLCRFDKVVMRAGCYLVRAGTAGRFVRIGLPVRMPADDLTGSEKWVGGPIYGVEPKCAMWDAVIPSDIWADTSGKAFRNASRRSLYGFFMRVKRRLKTALGRRPGGSATYPGKDDR